MLEQKKVAITLDDFPFAGPGDRSIRNIKAVNDSPRPQLKRHGIKAVGFVNEEKIERNEGLASAGAGAGKGHV